MLEVMLVIGFFILACCLAILVAPKILLKTINFFSVGSRVYLVGLTRIALGIALLILAPQAKFYGYVITLGLILSAFGLALFFFPLRRTKKLLHRIQNQSSLALRTFAIIGMAIWALLIYALLPAVP